jgi:hypothetical protein
MTMKIYELNLPDARAFNQLIEDGHFGVYWNDLLKASCKLELLVQIKIQADAREVLWFSGAGWSEYVRNPTVSVILFPSMFGAGDEKEIRVQLAWEERPVTTKVVPSKQILVDGVTYTSQSTVDKEFGDWTSRNVTRLITVTSHDVWGD